MIKDFVSFRFAVSTIMTTFSGLHCKTFSLVFSLFSGLVHLVFGVVKAAVLIKKKNVVMSIRNDECKSLLK